jgi:peptide/nickel transport system permease protein
MQTSQNTVVRLLKHPSGALGAAILVLILLMAATAGIFYPDGPWTMAGPSRLWPGQDPRFFLGTDGFGRDLAAGMMHGSRVSLAVGFAAAIVAIVVGTIVGALAGYYGRWVDDVLMRITDAFQTIPSFLAAVVIVGVLGPALGTIIVSIAMVSWPMIARLIRAEFMKLRDQDFVIACRISGMSDFWIIVRQILPNCLTPVIVASSLMVGTAIVVESGLSFLGLGDPNIMSWGSIIGGGRSAIRTSWYVTAIPATAVVATVLALNLLSDALNDVLNPRTHK